MDECYIGPEASLQLHRELKGPVFSFGRKYRDREHLGRKWQGLRNFPAFRCKDCKLVMFKYK